MSKERFAAWATIFCLVLAGCVARGAKPVLIEKSSDMAPRISKEELNIRLDDPSLSILDVRWTNHWEKSAIKIKGAIRENPDDVTNWFRRYTTSKTIALYCD